MAVRLDDSDEHTHELGPKSNFNAPVGLAE